MITVSVDKEISASVCALALVEVVARKNHIRVDDIFGRSRHRSIVRPRQEAYALVYALLGSFPQTGAFFDRDHTTIHHGVRAHEARRAAQQVNIGPT